MENGAVDLVLIREPNFQLCRVHIHVCAPRIYFYIKYRHRVLVYHNLIFVRRLESIGKAQSLYVAPVYIKTLITSVRARGVAFAD